MVNDNSKENLAKLLRLSPQERKVLRYRCQGWDYKAIAKTLTITDSSVKVYMDRIYNKLELKGYGRAARIKLLFEEYCPLLHQLGEKPVKQLPEPGKSAPEEEIPEIIGIVISPESEKILDEDEYAVVVYTPAPLVPIDHKRRGLRGLFFGVILGVVLGLLLAVAAYFFVQWLNNGTNPISPLPSPTIPAPALAPTSTPIPSSTPLPSPTSVISTQTPAIEKVIVVVTATPIPATEAPTSTATPALSLPLTDNFDNGINPNWQTITSQGTWRVINGRYTETGGETFQWGYSFIGDPNWQDYTVDVDYSLELDNVSSLLVIVRAGKQSNFGLAFAIINGEGSWRIWQDGQWQRLVTSNDYPFTKGHIKVQVQGSTFTASASGMSPLVITDASTTSGFVGLGVDCRSINDCATFDNFSVK